MTAMRRPSYGPLSPTVGERGARTRQLILDVTLELLAERGFYGIHTDDIAQAAGVSRATLYQYFEGKDEIFVELLNECGSALMRVVRRLGPLGPSAVAFDNLHWWLGEWAWVYDKYLTMFTEWAHADSQQTPVQPLVATFVDNYARQVADRLVRSGVQGVDAVALAKAILVVVHRFNYFRHTGVRRGVSDDVLLANLTIILQLVLFPQTPPEVLAGVVPADAAAGSARRAGSVPARRASVRSAARGPSDAGSVVPDWRADRFGALSPRSRATVRRLLDAACTTFARLNYRSATVDDVVAEAGLARGTFYKYFENKLDLMTVLAQEVRQEVLELAPRFAALAPGPEGSEELRAFLRQFVAFHARYDGVLRAWVEGEPTDDVLQAMGRQCAAAVRQAIAAMLVKVERPYPFDIDVASLVMLCVLERIPDVTTEWMSDVDAEGMVEVMAAFIERGLMNGRPLRQRPRRARRSSSP
jgi:AcrR family transcriptional regulator